MVSEGTSNDSTLISRWRKAITTPRVSAGDELDRSLESRAPTVLFVLHASPFSGDGGTAYHVRDLLDALSLERAVVAYPAGRELVVAEVFKGKVWAPTFYSFALKKPPDPVSIDDSEITRLVERWITLFSISGCHIHHLISWPISLGRLLTRLQIPYLFTSHDYYAVCPNWNLFDYDLGDNCECKWKEEEDAGCLRAFTKVVGRVSQIDLTRLRHAHRDAFWQFTSNAAGVVFPSEAARRRVLRALPLELKRTHVIEHGSDIRLQARRSLPGPNLRIAVVGGVAGPRKGSRNYCELVLKTSRLPAEWHFFGVDELPGLLSETIDRRKVQFHGGYSRDHIADLLAKQGIDLCVILPSVNETFSYVLSEIWAAGIPVIVNEKGSLPERVNRHGAGVVVNSIDEALGWIERFCGNRAEVEKLAARARAVRNVSNAENARAYLRLYQTLSVLGSGIRQDSLKEVDQRELVARNTSADPAAPPNKAIPEYQNSRWYSKFLAMKPYVPSAVRQMGRKVLVTAERKRRKRASLVRNYQQRLTNLQILHRVPSRVVLESTNAHPQIVFEVRPFRPETIQTIHFELRHGSNSGLISRLLWVHSFDEQFSDDKSVTFALENDRKWHRYLINIDGNLKAKWECGTEIVRLRFDPVNEPVRFEGTPIVLGSSLLVF